MSYDTKAGKSYRARLYLGRKCVHRIGSKKLQGIPPERVESLVAAAAAAYEERFLGPKKTEVPQPTTAVPQGPEFDYYVAKERFLDAVEVEIGSDAVGSANVRGPTDRPVTLPRVPPTTASWR